MTSNTSFWKTSMQTPGLFYKLASFLYSCYFWPEIWCSYLIMTWFNYHISQAAALAKHLHLQEVMTRNESLKWIFLHSWMVCGVTTFWGETNAFCGSYLICSTFCSFQSSIASSLTVAVSVCWKRLLATPELNTRIAFHLPCITKNKTLL